MQVGQGTTANIVVTTNDWNFAVTSSGGQQSYILTNAVLQLKESNGTTAPLTLTIYGNFGGTGTILYTTNIPASVFGGSFNVYNIAIPTIALPTGSYSIQLSSTDPKAYTYKNGALALGAVTTGIYWIPDSSPGYGTTNFNASDVFADYNLSTTNVVYNYHIGNNTGTSIILQNSGVQTVSNKTESLTVTGSAGGAGTITGLYTGYLLDQSKTNFTVAVASAVGTNSGSATLTFASNTNGTSIVSGDLTSIRGGYGGSTNIGSQTINIVGVGYRLATAGIGTTNINLGSIHAGGTFSAQSLVISNTAVADAYSEGLNASFGTLTGNVVTNGLINLLAAGASSSAMTVSLGDNTAGAKSGTVTLNLTSDGTGTSGLGLTALTGQTITVTGFVYTGQGVWNTVSSGSWSNASNWTAAGGRPGVDGALSLGDTATFGGGIASNTVVSLDGISPSLAGVTFNNSTYSYTLAAGSGGTLMLTNSGGNVAVTVASGQHTISAPVQLGRNVTMAVSNSTDRLTVSGPISGTGFGMTKTGNGILVLSGTNSYTGATVVDAGKLMVNGLTLASPITVNNGGTLGGSGTVGTVTINDGGILDVGANTFTVSNLVLTATATNKLNFTMPTSTTSGELILNSPLDLSKMTTDWFSFAAPNGFSAGTYTLIHDINGFIGSLSSATNFANINFGPDLTGSLVYDNVANNILLQVVAIPEPSAHLLVSIGIIGMFVFRRFRRPQPVRVER